MKDRIILYGVMLIVLMLAAIPGLHASHVEEKDRLLVIPLKALSGINKDEAILLSDILSVELHRSGKFTILNREDMKAVLDEKEFELAMGCEDNVCLLENVAKLAANKIITGNIGKLGSKYIVSIRMINEDGENEIMENETCACKIDELDITIKRVANRCLRYLNGETVQDNSTQKAPAYQSQYAKAPYVNLRSRYIKLSEPQLNLIPYITINEKPDWGFVGYSTINHSYELKSINGDKVVIDYATGLMWHQYGSDDSMVWKEVKQWVSALNGREYAGYRDWRLPTVEEATSLLESSKKNGDLYIDSVFDAELYTIWTGDKCDWSVKAGMEGMWSVGFSQNGAVECNLLMAFTPTYYVRPVRSYNWKDYKEPKPVIKKLPVTTHKETKKSSSVNQNSSTKELKPLAKTDPDNTAAFCNIGVAFIDSGKYEEAIETFNLVLTINPDYARAHFLLGGAYFMSGMQKEAIEACKQSIRINSDFAEAYYFLGVIYTDSSMYNEAIQACKQAIMINPDYAKAYATLGVAYGRTGMYKEEIESYKQAIRIGPDDAVTHFNLGIAYGSFDKRKAMEAYKQAIKIDPDYASAHYNLGNTYKDLSMYKEAVESYKQAIRVNPDFVNAHLNLGTTYAYSLNDNSSAMEQYRILQNLDPEKAKTLKIFISD